MSSQYKYFPTLLLEYNKKSNEPVKIYSSNIINFHYSQPEYLYYKEQFEINPFTEEELALENSIYDSIPEASEPLEKITFGTFRDQEYDQNTGEIISIMNGANFPYLFIPHDRWWEYEKFQKFPDYPTWYPFKFQEWHKHIIMSKYQTVLYDPLWSTSSTSSHPLSQYYYSTTLKYYRPWRYSESSGVFYQSFRIPIYLLMSISLLGYYIFHHLMPRSRLHTIMLSEDFWIRDFESMRSKLNDRSPHRQLVDEEVSARFDSFAFLFFVGPEQSKIMKNSYVQLGKMTKADYYDLIKA